MLPTRRMTVAKADQLRLQRMMNGLATAREPYRSHIRELAERLEQANVVLGTEVGSDVVTMRSPHCQSISVTFQPCFSAYMRYIRASISAQSWLSVPPAPLFICNTAGSSSSGSLSVLLNSASSIFSIARSKASFTSSSLVSPAFQKSNNTAKSSTAVLTSS